MAILWTQGEGIKISANGTGNGLYVSPNSPITPIYHTHIGRVPSLDDMIDINLKFKNAGKNSGVLHLTKNSLSELSKEVRVYAKLVNIEILEDGYALTPGYLNKPTLIDKIVSFFRGIF